MDSIPKDIFKILIEYYLPNRRDRLQCARVSKAWNQAMQQFVPNISTLYGPPGSEQVLRGRRHPNSRSRLGYYIRIAHKTGRWKLKNSLGDIAFYCLDKQQAIYFKKLWGGVAEFNLDKIFKLKSPPHRLIPFFGGFWLNTKSDDEFCYLLRQGANPNTVLYGDYAVFSAQWNRRRFKALIDAGANLRVCSSVHRRALISNVILGKNADYALEVTLMMLDADPKLINHFSKREHAAPPLSLAILKNNVPLVEALIQRGANVDEPSADRVFNPLWMAVRNQQLHLTRLLLEAGADPILPRYRGQTLLELAQGNPEITAMLQEAIDQRRAPEAIPAEVPMDEPQAPPPGHAHPVPIDEPVVQAEAPAARPFEHLELACLLAIGTYALWRGLRLRART